MCGIFMCLSESDEIFDEKFKILSPFLKNRGPDSCRIVKRKIILENGKIFFANFFGCVLWLRGSHQMTEQPTVDSDENILLWNGDIFEADFLTCDVSSDDASSNDITSNTVPSKDVSSKDDTSIDLTSKNVLSNGVSPKDILLNEKSDTEILSKRLQMLPDDDIPEEMSKIRGPFAFVYFRPRTGKIWFGRDFFGRHSLEVESGLNDFTLSSVGHKRLPSFKEVPAAGLFHLDLQDLFGNIGSSGLFLHPWIERRIGSGFSGFDFETRDPIRSTVSEMPDSEETEFHESAQISSTSSQTSQIEKLLENSDFKSRVDHLTSLLSESVRRRVVAMPKFCKKCLQDKNDECRHSKLGVLFSGGLDSTVLACLADRCLDESEPLDLLNVAFEQPDGSFDVPDRLTAFKALAELEAISPTRKFNLVLVNVGKKELVEMRESVISHLLFPLSTVLDDSIGCAIWFAARGHGRINLDESESGKTYRSPVRVLLLGAGADEQLGGYSRHRMRFQKSGLAGLQNEIRLEMDRISERNLGRDNRIVSDHGVEGRYPFLDENVVSYLNGLCLEHKCDLRLERGLGEKLLLRGVAFDLGLRQVAFEPKRAIQFGSRIARMENRKEKASDQALR